MAQDSRMAAKNSKLYVRRAERLEMVDKVQRAVQQAHEAAADAAHAPR
jgi:hypothetical protein